MKAAPLLFGIVFLFWGNGFTTECNIDTTKENLVKFISDAPIEEIEGITDNIDGYVFWEGDDILEKSELYFEIELNSLDTGIGLRNRHMRENYLETDKYPITHYTGKLVKAEEISENESQVTTNGKIFIHGIEQDLSTTAMVTVQDKHYHILCTFQVKLSDFDIKIPKLMFLKINETINIELDFHVKEIEKDN